MGRQVPAIEKEEYSSTLECNYRGSSPACCDPCFPGGALHRIVNLVAAFSVGRARTQPRSSKEAARLKAIGVSACARPECCLLLHSVVRGHRNSVIALARRMLFAPPPQPPPTPAAAAVARPGRPALQFKPFSLLTTALRCRCSTTSKGLFASAGDKPPKKLQKVPVGARATRADFYIHLPWRAAAAAPTCS